MKGKHKNIIFKKYLFVISLIFTLLSVKGTAQESLLSERIHILKSYDSAHLFRIALPLGGIGTGTVSLGGRGELKDWEIMNIPGKGFSTIESGNNAPFFAIYTKTESGKTNSKALIGPFDNSEYEGKQGSEVDQHGFPRFRNATFDAAYPFGIVKLSDNSFPARIKVVGYNPLIPGDANASGIPVAILEYEVENITGEELEVSISGNIRNFIGRDGRDQYGVKSGSH